MGVKVLFFRRLLGAFRSAALVMGRSIFTATFRLYIFSHEWNITNHKCSISRHFHNYSPSQRSSNTPRRHHQIMISFPIPSTLLPYYPPPSIRHKRAKRTHQDGDLNAAPWELLDATMTSRFLREREEEEDLYTLSWHLVS